MNYYGVLNLIPFSSDSSGICVPRFKLKLPNWFRTNNIYYSSTYWMQYSQSRRFQTKRGQQFTGTSRNIITALVFFTIQVNRILQLGCDNSGKQTHKYRYWVLKQGMALYPLIYIPVTMADWNCNAWLLNSTLWSNRLQTSQL